MRCDEVTCFAVVCGVAIAGASAPAQAAKFKVVHSFAAGDGDFPYSGLINVDGTLYGTTTLGGSQHEGTIFSFNTKTGIEQVVHSFGGDDGSSPNANLINVGGTLYGPAPNGGGSRNCNAGCGTVFSLDLATGLVGVVYAFTGGDDGGNSYASLVDVGGTLYGTTRAGGAHKFGTVFSVNPSSGVEQVLYSFQKGLGGYPAAGLVKLGDKLYGTASYAGRNGGGMIFSFDIASGKTKVVYEFQGGSDGETPDSALINIGGLLYGTTANGGSSANCSIGCGTVFSLNPETGAESVVYPFQGSGDGADPAASVIDVNGTLYGTTAGGGGASCYLGCGTVFSLNPATGAEQVVSSFPGGRLGANPYSSLTSVGHAMFGTTSEGGSNKCADGGCGTVFRLRP